MKEIINKLDLEEYLETLQNLFAREKSIILEGDINIHYKLISQISNYDLKPLPKVEFGVYKLPSPFGFAVTEVLACPTTSTSS